MNEQRQVGVLCRRRRVSVSCFCHEAAKVATRRYVVLVAINSVDIDRRLLASVPQLTAAVHRTVLHTIAVLQWELVGWLVVGVTVVV